MSMVPKESIEVIAQTMGFTNLSPDAAADFAPDVEYRLREIIQESLKCTRHSKRRVMTSEDVDSALRLRNIEPIYGFASGDPLRFKRAVGHKDLFYVDDKDVDFKDVIEAPLPKAPLDTTVVAHWLAIEGIQPAIPENPPLEAFIAPAEAKKTDHAKDDVLSVDVKVPVKHVLSKELQLYFDKIKELILHKSQSILFKDALLSLATDAGLHPLVPYFSLFVADEVTHNLNNIPLLFAIMRVVQSLLRNNNIHIEPYLHQMMPSIITCLVAKRLGQKFSDNHWELRDFSASLIASICRRFGHMYHNLQSRVTRTLLHAFLDPSKSMTQHYGAVKGLTALGSNVVRLLILPNLETYLQLLEPEMLLEKQKNEMKRIEAWHVCGALLFAAGQCLRERMKMFPRLLTPPSRYVWKTTSRVVTSSDNKRKAGMTGMDISPQQPPLKKLASDGSISSMTNAVMPSNMLETPDRFPATTNPETAGQAEIETSQAESKDKVGSGKQAPKSTAAALPQAWKEDTDAGHLLASLFELFGEAILPFAQPVEMSFFV